MKNTIKIIPLDIEEELSGDTRVEEIALVYKPAIETEFIFFNKQEFETYNDYPQAAKDNACKVIRWKEEYGDEVNGMTQVGWIRANQLCSGENLSVETIARMSAFQRHRQNSEIAEEYKGTPWKDAGYVAWLGWGGDEGIAWASNKLQQIKEEMGDSICEYDCGCGNKDNPLYFGMNIIDGMPVFETEEEALQYADKMGCSGTHTHTIDGQEYYMPCEIHPDNVNDLIEDLGVELEELLKQGWTIEEANVVNDVSEIRNEFKKQCEDITYEKFYQIITTPGEYSRMDYGNRTRRYVYMTGMGRAELIETSREFCRRMLGGRQFVFRIEDIERLSAEIEAEGNNYKIIPRPKGTSVDIFTYKGGANCAHYWMEIILQPPTIYDNAPKATNNKRRMIEESVIQLPADGQSGIVNPPVNYGSRSPQSVGMKKTSATAIIVDIDGTLLDGSTGKKPIIDYVNRRWENNRIVIISGRQISRLSESKAQLEKVGVKYDEIHLSDFPVGPNASNAFKKYKADLLKKQGYTFLEAIDDNAEARKYYRDLGIQAKAPSSINLTAVPSGILQGLPIYQLKEDAVKYSTEMGCNGIVEEVEYMGEKQFQACSYKRQQMSQQFSVNEEKRMLYSPAMKPNILIPRIDETTREMYFVTFTPETILKMSQRFLIEKRTDKTNLEHSSQKFDGVYLVESWIVEGEKDKAYQLGYDEFQIPKGTWMVGYKIVNDEVWSMIKNGEVKGLSIEGNFNYNLSQDIDEKIISGIVEILLEYNDSQK